MNKIIDENTRCQFCNSSLLITSKDYGKNAICDDCHKSLFRWRIVFVIIIGLLYGFIVSFLMASEILLGAIPTLLLMFVLLFLGNKLAIIATKNKFMKRKDSTKLKTKDIKTEVDTTTDTIIQTNHVSENTKQNNRKKPSNKISKHCKKCGCIIDQVSKKCTGCGKQYFKLRINKIVIISSILLFILASLNIFQFIELIKKDEIIKEKSTKLADSNKLYDDLCNNNSELRKQKERIQKKYNKISDAYDFYHENSAIVYDDGSKKYHTYECPKYKNSTISFNIYNTEWAEQEGYKPCSKCHKSDDSFYTIEDYYDEHY